MKIFIFCFFIPTFALNSFAEDRIKFEKKGETYDFQVSDINGPNGSTAQEAFLYYIFAGAKKNNSDQNDWNAFYRIPGYRKQTISKLLKVNLVGDLPKYIWHFSLPTDDLISHKSTENSEEIQIKGEVAEVLYDGIQNILAYNDSLSSCDKEKRVFLGKKIACSPTKIRIQSEEYDSAQCKLTLDK
ncbi:MAG: hypothetical protein KA715_12910 [Xanthomonadaceae bacterium]|nr:hypothetical protein [Xanthomonadaceae bacterium]